MEQASTQPFHLVGVVLSWTTVLPDMCEGATSTELFHLLRLLQVRGLDADDKPHNARLQTNLIRLPLVAFLAITVITIIIAAAARYDPPRQPECLTCRRPLGPVPLAEVGSQVVMAPTFVQPRVGRGRRRSARKRSSNRV